MDKDYGSRSLADLKAELKKRNAKVTGKKALLVQRLEDYDKLFGQLVNDPESVFKIDVPSPEHFRDVTRDSTMPKFGEEDLNHYCQLSGREEVKTAQSMYEEKFLTACRQAFKDNYFFITAVCQSEMRKSVRYNVTIKAQDFLVAEAQCECAAGVGPYAQCKHVLVVIFAIINFNRNQNIKLQESSTSTLQSFHQPYKMYRGNSVLAEDLKLKVNKNHFDSMTTFDPRSLKIDQEKYKDYFKNLITSYCGGEGRSENKKVPLGQLIKPANKHAVLLDHDYLEKTAENEFFDSLVLSHDQIKDLEARTKADKNEWRDQRKLRLQSSDFGKICGQIKNKKNLARSLMKTDYIQTPAIKHGVKYESQAIKKFVEVTKSVVSKCGIIIHPELQFLGSTPDGLVGGEAMEVLEVKCPYTAKDNIISPESVPYIYLCEKTGTYKLKATHHYFYQVQGQMFCTQTNIANFFIYTLCDCYLIKIEKDLKFIEEMLCKLHVFYEDYYKPELLHKFLYNLKS